MYFWLTNRMPFSLRRQPNLFNLPKQNSPLAISDSSVSDSVPPRFSSCLSCDLCVLQVLTQTLKAWLLKGFPTSPACRAQGNQSPKRNQPPGCPSHPRDLRATLSWDLKTQAPPGPKRVGGAGRHGAQC